MIVYLLENYNRLDTTRSVYIDLDVAKTYKHKPCVIKEYDAEGYETKECYILFMDYKIVGMFTEYEYLKKKMTSIIVGMTDPVNFKIEKYKIVHDARDDDVSSDDEEYCMFCGEDKERCEQRGYCEDLK